jgi:hypothetical protein
MSNINAQPGNSTAFTALIKYSDGTANLALQTNGANAVVINQSQIANFVSMGAVKIPAGTLAERPANAVNGMFRYNTTNATFEAYISGTWTFIP